MRGYKADGDDSTAKAGTCEGATDCGIHTQGTHSAAIIAAGIGNNGIQGIAYGPKIKPVNIYKSSGSFSESITGVIDGSITTNIGNIANEAERIEAIKAASGAGITVMNNGWGFLGTKEVTAGGGATFYYKSPAAITISNAEINAWKKAVETTVVVFAAGDQGHNVLTGMVQTFTDEALTMPSATYGYVDLTGSASVATAHASLQRTVDGGIGSLVGKWLSVVALDEDNNIMTTSNGCGVGEAYCLGAPGYNINSAIPGDGTYETQSGTAIAAAHVSAAIAIVASTFPTDPETGLTTATPTELVTIILDSATNLGAAIGVYGQGALNLAAATAPMTMMDEASITAFGNQRLAAGASIDKSGITIPTSFGGALDGFTVGFTDDYDRAFIGSPVRITRTNAAFTLGDTLKTWDSPELQSIALDSNSKMQFTNYDENADAKDTLIFTHHLPNHTIGFSYNEEHRTPDLRLAGDAQELHFQKIRPIASDLMQLHATHKLGKSWNVKNAITSGEFDTGNRFNEAMANLNYAGENRNLTIGAGTLQEYEQFLGASGTGAYQLSDATSSTVTHLAISQNLPRNSAIKLKYTNFKTEVDMRYSNFAKINDLTADEYQLTLTKRKILGKSDSLNIELIQPFAVTDGNLQQNTVLGYNDAGDYNNVTQNYDLAPANRRQQIRMTWQNQVNFERKTKLFISMQYENHVNNLRDNENSQILGGISTRF